MTLLYYTSPSTPRIHLSRTFTLHGWRSFPPLTSNFTTLPSSPLAATTVTNNGIDTKAHRADRPLLAYENPNSRLVVADYIHFWGVDFTTAPDVRRLEAAVGRRPEGQRALLGDGEPKMGGAWVLQKHVGREGTSGFVVGYETVEGEMGLVFSKVEKYSMSIPPKQTLC
jgi:hypothetical protein